MGVGKTTLGKALAQALNLEFVDLDLYIQSRYQKSISQIFADSGEEGFRQIENKMLKEVSDFENVIISTGGGAPCFYDNIDIMNAKGTTIYLQAEPRLLSERLVNCKEKRPLLHNKTDDELHLFVKENIEKREPFYSKAKIIFNLHELVNRDEIDKYINKIIGKLNKELL